MISIRILIMVTCSSIVTQVLAHFSFLKTHKKQQNNQKSSDKVIYLAHFTSGPNLQKL